LYVFGGIYSDAKQKFMVPLDELYTHEDTLVLTMDIPHGPDGIKSKKLYEGIQISFMVSRPRQPVFKRAIEMIVDNVRNKYYGNSYLDVTGPALFYRALVSLGREQTYVVAYKQQDDNHIVDMKDIPIIECKTIGENSFKSGAYAENWNKRNVFK
jgi:mannosyltransferase OCH1-like enzyme